MFEKKLRETSPADFMSQRTLPPSGRVTTLVPFPFFFRRAFITIKLEVKYKNKRIIEEFNMEPRKTFTGGNEIRYVRVIDVKRIANMRTLQKARNREILDSVKRNRGKLTIFEVTYLDEINLKSRVNSANNNVNFCHSNII